MVRGDTARVTTFTPSVTPEKSLHDGAKERLPLGWPRRKRASYPL
jgi:hypothetical protein